MRILHILYFSDMGGIESYATDLFRGLAARGHESVLLYDGAEPPGPGAGVRARCRLTGMIEHGRGHGEKLARTALRSIDQWRCDLAFLHLTMNGTLSESLLARVPTVYFAHNYGALCPSGALLYERSDRICDLQGVPDVRCLVNAYLEGCNTRHPARLWGRYRRTVETAAWTRRADALVCDSEYVRRRHVDNGWPRERVHVVPSPVRMPPEPWPPAVRERSLDRQPIVLFAGRVTPQKGLEYLLRAEREIDRPHRLVVAGDGYQMPAMRALAMRLGLAGRVEFAGRLDRKALDDLYTRASVVVVPSIWPEPFGMVGPEAMAHGVPVVAFRVGGIPEWLTDQETGCLVEPRDVAGLARAIRRILDDPVLARRLGERARLVARQNFTSECHVERLEAIFRDAIAKRSRDPVVLAGTA